MSMASVARASLAVARKDMASSLTERTFTIISMVIPVNYLLLFVIIVAAGARAPIAVVMQDRGAAAHELLTAMENSRSFVIRVVDAGEAARRFDDGTVVAVVTVPASLERDIDAGRRVALPVTVNNLNVDFTDDIRRALPESITAFTAVRYPTDVAVQPKEIDLRRGEPGYLQYIAVSSVVIAVALGGMLPAGTLAAREYDAGTLKTILLAPVSRLAIQAGHIAAGVALALPTVLLLIAITVGIIGVRPARPLELGAATAMLLLLFVAIGNLAGNLLRRRSAVIPICAGMTIPLFAIGGAFIPVSWTHPFIAIAAHFSPTYYGVAALQHAFYGVSSTPQGIRVNLAVLAAATVLAVAASTRLVFRYEVDH